MTFFEGDSDDFLGINELNAQDTSISFDNLSTPLAVDFEARLQDHDRRLAVLENTSTVAGASATTTTSVATAISSCPVGGCGNKTGLNPRAPPYDIKKHLCSRTHIEAAMCLVPPALFHSPLPRLCACNAAAAAAPPPLTVDCEQLLTSERNGNVVEFFAGIKVQFCQNRACLALRDAAPPLLRAIELAQVRLRDTIYNANGSRKRVQKKRNGDHLQGDQTVAVAFGADKFATPGAVYVVFDAVANQLRVQMTRPAASTFHVAHVARMHRWMRHVLHFAPQQHRLWDSHVAVADSGFVDAFVLAKQSDIGDIDSATDRERLHQRIAAGELVLCAGRSDGWLDLVAASAIEANRSNQRVTLPLSHLQPHSFRRYDAQAQPSLPLLSERHGAPLQGFDVRMQHYAPRHVAVGAGTVKIEMLCKCAGWYLVALTSDAGAASVRMAFDDQLQRGRDLLCSLIDLTELEQESQPAREAMSARQRAIEAIEQAEHLRIQNIALSQRLADAERAASEQSARDNAALVARVAALEQQLAQAKQRPSEDRKAKRSSNAAPPLPLPLPFPPTRGRTRHTLESLLVKESAPTTATVEREMLTTGKRIALYYRRDNRNDLRLCIRDVSGVFVHSKISKNGDGSLSCVRELCAATLEELLNEQLQLDV